MASIAEPTPRPRRKGRRWRAVRLLEFLAGVGPDSERVQRWLDAHQAVALAVMLLCALAVMTADSWF